jgi:hypothetical protein
MSKVWMLVGLMWITSGAQAGSGAVSELECHYSGHIVAWTLKAQIRHLEGTLTYALWKNHATQAGHAFELKGGNEGLAWASTSITQIAAGNHYLKISAEGGWMDRTVPVVTQRVEIRLAKSILGYSLAALIVDGEPVDLESGAGTSCRFE